MERNRRTQEINDMIKKSHKDIVLILIMALYNLTIFIGTAYLVQFYHWSSWWFLFDMLIISYREKDKNE